MKICPKCKCENPDTANFCRNCRENIQFLTPDLEMDAPTSGQNDRFGGWGGDFDRTGTAGVPGDFSRTTAADSWGDDPGQTRSPDDWNMDPDRTRSFDNWGETAADTAPLRENPAAGQEHIDGGKASSGDDFRKMAQGLFADDFSDSQASGEAKRRQKRADAQQKEREKRRRQEDDRKKQERKKKKEKAPSDSWETGADDGGNDNSGEWIDNRGNDKPVKKDSSGNVIKIIAGLVVVAILAVAIVLIFRKINRPPTPKPPVEEGGNSGSQVEGGETGQDEGSGSSGSQSAATDENSGSAGESQTSDEDIGFSEEDFNSGMYSTVVTLKSQYLDEVSLYNEPGEFTVDTIPEAAVCALVTQRSVGGITWDYVDYCGKTGWVMDQYIRHVGDDVQYFYPGNDFGNTVYVNHLKTIKVHSKPNSDPSTVCGEGIPYGTEFEIDRLDRGWGHTYYNGQECWIDMNVVAFYASFTWQIEKANGNSTGIKLRQGPGEGTMELTKIPLRTMINEVEHRNGWVRVNYGGQSGWVKLHYATPCGSDGLDFSEG